MTDQYILVVDDEKEIRDAMRMILEYKGYDTLCVSNGMEAIRILETTPVVLTFLDMKLPGMDGIEILKTIKKKGFATEVVMISGHGSVDVAVEAIRLGAKDFIEKPLERERILITCSHVLDNLKLKQENVQLKQKLEGTFEMIGESPAMRALRETIRKAAPTNATVLITGESGSGKELIAREIHRYSSRAKAPFVHLNCAAIPDELIENEMFGHEKGAFTGATEKRAGKIELAHTGTLFLDEVGDMSLKTQAKTLRVLETREFQKIGGKETVTIDIRLVAATNKNLEEEIKADRFREDLYFRLRVIPVHCPPLRERKEDIPLLVNHFSSHFLKENGLPPKSFHTDTIVKLQEHQWPGNIRELKNTIERLLIMCPEKNILPTHLPPEIVRVMPDAVSLPVNDLSLKDFRDMMEKKFILRKLEENNWNIQKTARILNTQRSNLYKKMEQYGITKP